MIMCSYCALEAETRGEEQLLNNDSSSTTESTIISYCEDTYLTQHEA